MADYPEGSLGWWIETRRAELGLTIAQLAARANVSDETVRQAKSDRPMRPITQHAIEAALGWEKGSIDAITSGRTPTVRARRDDPSRVDGASYDAQQVQLIRAVAVHMEQEGVPRHAIRDFLIKVAAEYTNQNTVSSGSDTAS